MKYLHEYVYSFLDTERIERKFIMSQGQSVKATAILLGFGFIERYKARQVSSVYFDDLEHSCLRDNIDGVPYRDKLRVRYYDEALDRAKIEIKHRRNNVGFKSTFDLTVNPVSRGQVLNSAKEWCRENILNTLQPSAYVSYTRRYFAKDTLRATVDERVVSGRLIGMTSLASAMVNYEVVEFKYPLGMDQEFRSLYKNIDQIALRNTKSSKYSNALMFY